MSAAHGPRVVAGEVEFRVWAPKLEQLSLALGERTLPMHRAQDGYFTRMESCRPDERYWFVFPDGHRRADPAARRLPEGVHGPSQLFDPARFRWTDAGFGGHAREALLFYELHVGTFTHEGTLEAAAERLEDLAELGVTCLELMPVQPFAGARNWGYDGVAPYAVHEPYGGPAALQRFVDRAHALGLSVCLDVVLNHLGPEGNYLPEFGAYFTDRHRSPWGDGIDFDSAASAPVRRFFLDAALQWLNDFHVDALRLDATHAIQDDSRTHLVAQLCAEVRSLAAQLGRPLHVIAENDGNDRRVLDARPTGWGVDAVWADDFHHAVHALLTGERQRYFQDYGQPGHLAKALRAGWTYQGQHSRFRGGPHGTPTTGLDGSRFVLCVQNHDQVGNRPLGERLSALTDWDSLCAATALLLLSPGLPLLFMGDEYGETKPFLYFTSHTDPDLARAVTEGRRAELIAVTGGRPPPDPQAVETFEASKLTHRRDGRHGELRDLVKRLIALRKAHLPAIAREWPRVQWADGKLTLARPSLTLRMSLEPAEHRWQLRLSFGEHPERAPSTEADPEPRGGGAHGAAER